MQNIFCVPPNPYRPLYSPECVAVVCYLEYTTWIHYHLLGRDFKPIGDNVSHTTFSSQFLGIEDTILEHQLWSEVLGVGEPLAASLQHPFRCGAQTGQIALRPALFLGLHHTYGPLLTDPVGCNF